MMHDQHAEILRDTDMGTFENSANNIFDDQSLLSAYDRVLTASQHYHSVLQLHVDELKNCQEVLDIGCGSGNLVLELLQRGIHVTATDSSAMSLNYLSQQSRIKYLDSLLTVRLIDAANLHPFSSKNFDGVSSMIMAHLLDNFKTHIFECYRVLKTGGQFIITARAYGQDPERLVQSVKQSLINAGLFEQLEKDYEMVVTKVLRTANHRSKSLLTPERACRIVKECGFKGIQFRENLTSEVMYSISATKL